MARDSLHIQILRALYEDVANRQRALERKVGRGVPEKDYREHIGRIKEGDVFLEAIKSSMKTGVDDLEEREERREREQNDRASRRRS
jgi:hypothetical protein